MRSTGSVTSVLRRLPGALVSTLTTLLLLAGTASGQESINLGIIYDLSGPLAGGGSRAGSIGTEIAIEMVNERGGVLGRHPVEYTLADAQSKPDVAINEAERLLNQEQVDLLTGVYSSAQAVPLAQRVDRMEEFFWVQIAISSAVFKGRNLRYVFRPQTHSDQYGDASVGFIAENADKFGKAPEDLRVAIIHEDGPYGTGVADSNAAAAEAHDMNIVLHEGYSHTAPDLSSLIVKLKRARPDVILHTGYNPDITLFFRQARELGLTFGTLVGHGAGYAQLDKLVDTFGSDIDHIFNVDPAAAQLLDPDTLSEGLGELTEELVRRYRERTGATDVPPHASMGFNHTWILLTDVIPRAIENYGDWSPQSLRKAALETDIPEGGTIQGYGVKFYPPGHEMAGQNMRSFPIVMQYIGGQSHVSHPASIQTREPVLPLPDSSPYAP